MTLVVPRTEPVVAMPSAAQAHDAGERMHALIRELYPICRSITGDGVRETLRRIRRRIPLEVHEVASGTRVFDWEVPHEWNIRAAWIADSRGNRVVDFARNNLHVVGYSVPVRARMSLEQLRGHLHSLPDQPDRIPYRTAYYSETWGFCLTHEQLEALPDDTYEVVIDSSRRPGHLTYGEVALPGRLEDEVLISCHVCHPSLCNDNLSGIAVATELASRLLTRERRYTYRFLFIPVTIGAITWLALNRERTARIRHGIVLAGVGDPGPVSWKRTRHENASIDRAAGHVLRHREVPGRVLPFDPYGYDERQFCSPGFDLPVGRLSRTPFGQYPEYHTSGDDLAFVRSDALEDSLSVLEAVLRILEGDARFRNRNPMCEPQLGRRGLWDAIGGTAADVRRMALLWVLNCSDGDHSLLDIAERADLPFDTIREMADLLLAHELLEPVGGEA